MSSVGTATFTAVADFSQVRSEMKRTQGAMDDFDQSMRGIGDNDPSQRVGRDWGKTAKTMKNTGRSMTLGLTLPLTLLGGAALKTFADFETAIANVQANSGATAEEMERVRQTAKQMGRETAFTSTDAANALFQLSAAGYNVNQSIAAVESTMLLASASGVSLEDATDLVTKSMKAFSLEAEDAGHVSDVFTQAANQTAVQIQDLHDGMAQAGQLGARYNQSLESVTAGLSALIEQGVPAASAGVGLRQAFDKLAAPTTKAAGWIDELGIQVRNADGSMKQLPDVIGELEKGFEGLSQAQRDAAMQAIFGVEGAKAMSLAMNYQYEASTSTAQGAEAVKKATETMGQAWVDAHMEGDTLVATGADAVAMLTAMNEASDGTARAFDDIKKETPARKMEELKGSFEELLNSMMAAVGGPLKGLLEGLTGVVNVLAGFADAHPTIAALAVGFLAVLAVVGPLLVMTAHVIEAMIFLKGLGMATVFANMARSAWAFVTALVRMAVTAAIATARFVAMTVAMVAQAVASGVVRIATMLWTAAQWLLNVALTANPIGVVIMAIAALVAAIVWLWNNNEGFRNAVLKAWDAIKKAFAVVVQFVKERLMPLFKVYFAIWKKQWEIAWKIVSTVVRLLIAYWKTLYKWWQNLVGGIAAIWKGVWEGFVSIVSGVWNAITGIVSGGINAVKSALQSIWDAVVSFFEAIRNAPILSMIFDVMFASRDLAVGLLKRVFGFSQGGIVPGRGSRDTQPAMLTPGEAVLPKDVVKRLGRRQVEALIDGRMPTSLPAAVSTVADRSESRSMQVNVYNPKPERASDSLPRSIRKLQWMGVA